MSDVEAQTTLRDQLEAAFDTHKSEDNVSAEPVDIPQEPSRARDEAGRFAKVEAKPEVAAAPIAEVPTETPQEAAPAVKPRPTSWKKDYEEDWSKLDPRLQDYMLQREADFAKGVSTYKQNWAQAEPLWDAMQPFMPILEEHKIAPQEWISSLGNAHVALVRGSPEQKLQIFSKLASDYGVPLQALTGQQTDPQMFSLIDRLNRIERQYTSDLRTRESQEQANLTREIMSFSEGKPHFEAVRETMAQLLQSGVAGDLQSAYDKAIRLHDDIWQQQQEEARQAQARQEAEKRQQQVAKARATAVSPRSISPTATVNGSGKKDIRSILSEQLDQISGRV